MKWSNKGKQFEDIAECICKMEYNYYIWGAGITGELIYEKMKNYISIRGFIDSNPQKQHTLCSGICVYSPEEIVKLCENNRYLITPAFYEEIAEKLIKMQLIENKDFFNSLTFSRIFLLYKHQEVMIYRTDISITEKCTLKCQKCNMFMPYFENPKHRDINLIKDDVDYYFQTVSYLCELKLLGGEPFLYPDFAELLTYISNNYGNRIGRIEIFTNATIRLSEEILEVLKSNRIFIGITNYTNVVPYQKRLKEFCSDLDNYQIKYRCDKYDNWVDFGFPDNPYNLIDEEKLISHFDACHFEGRGLYNKRLYFCHMLTSAVRCNLFPEAESDYIELGACCNKAELMEFEMGYCENGYHDFCKVCRGCRSQIVIPAAVQKAN